LFTYLAAANVTCPDGFVKCGGAAKCVYEMLLCDGHNNCGDFWDEDSETCGQFRY